jgi:hypothetical protein
MRSIVMSTSWGKVEEPRGYDASSTSFKCLIEDSSSSEDSEEEEEEDIVPASVNVRKCGVKYRKIVKKEPLLPE